MARPRGPWTDLYSVGVTAFELFVGPTHFGDTKEPWHEMRISAHSTTYPWRRRPRSQPTRVTATPTRASSAVPEPPSDVASRGDEVAPARQLAP
jgi:hypothetical protein